ncbi:MAG: hypothetical protein IPO08_20890 [Xanthomonadales bacterium]|nr:hypothetical protein [Xanthomonadales bacterium]
MALHPHPVLGFGELGINEILLRLIEFRIDFTRELLSIMTEWNLDAVEACLNRVLIVCPAVNGS